MHHCLPNYNIAALACSDCSRWSQSWNTVLWVEEWERQTRIPRSAPWAMICCQGCFPPSERAAWSEQRVLQRRGTRVRLYLHNYSESPILLGRCNCKILNLANLISVVRRLLNQVSKLCADPHYIHAASQRQPRAEHVPSGTFCSYSVTFYLQLTYLFI